MANVPTKLLIDATTGEVYLTDKNDDMVVFESLSILDNLVTDAKNRLNQNKSKIVTNNARSSATKSYTKIYKDIPERSRMYSIDMLRNIATPEQLVILNDENILGNKIRGIPMVLWKDRIGTRWMEVYLELCNKARGIYKSNKLNNSRRTIHHDAHTLYVAQGS